MAVVAVPQLFTRRVHAVKAFQWFEGVEHAVIKRNTRAFGGKVGQAYIERDDGMQVRVEPGCWVLLDQDDCAFEVMTDEAFHENYIGYEPSK